MSDDLLTRTRTPQLVGALVTASTRLAEVDDIAHAFVEVAASVGIDPVDLVVGTHRVVGRDDVRLAVTVGGVGIGAEALADLLEAAPAASAWVGGPPESALCVGRRCQGSPELVEAARTAIRERQSRSGGRCVHYPGVGALVGVRTAAEIVGLSAIDTVLELAGVALRPEAAVRTRNHVRPRWQFGTLVLYVQPSGRGPYVPFEAPPAAGPRHSALVFGDRG